MNAGKTVFGAKKLYGIVSGWAGLGSSSITEKAVEDYNNDVDGLLCSDELAKRILESQLPQFDKDKIVVVGSPVIDALELNRAEEIERQGKEKLHIGEKEYVITYLGDISDYHKIGYDVDERINEKTFERLLDNINQIALEHHEQNFCILVRPHPRDPNMDELRTIAEKYAVPSNLKITWASRDEATMQEVAYASDVITSIISTENILAVLRGRHALYLGYENRLGEDVLRKTYNPDTLRVIGSQPGICVAHSGDDVVDYLRDCLSTKGKNKNQGMALVPEDSVERIVDIILNDKK